MSRGRVRKYLTDAATLPRDAASAWRTDGAAGVWTELRRRTVDRAAGYVRYIVLEADIADFRRVPPPDGVVIKPFTDTNWVSLGPLVPCRVAPIFTEALRAGRLCLVAWRGSEALGYVWLSPAVDERYENFALALPPDTTYLWQIQVTRSARRRGLGAALVSAGLERAAQQGLRRMWMITRRSNTAAQRTVTTVTTGRVLGSISRVKLASWMQSRFVPLQDSLPLHSYIRP